MARIRTIKPEICVSEQVADCSTTARLLFLYSWLHFDDYGNHPAKPRQLKAECFPYDDFTADQIREFMEELISVGLVVEYKHPSDDGLHWHITGWHHQKIEKRGKPRSPKFDEQVTIVRGTVDERSANALEQVDDSSVAYRTVKESTGALVPESTEEEERATGEPVASPPLPVELALGEDSQADPPSPPPPPPDPDPPSDPPPKSKPSKFKPAEIALPFDSEEFRAAWVVWCKHRSEIRQPLKPSMCDQQLAMLREWGESRAIAAIRHTVAMGWTGLREPEVDRNRGAPAPMGPDDWEALVFGNRTKGGRS